MAIAPEQITAIIAAETGLDAAALTPDTTLADLAIDSLDLASVAFEIEDRFGVAIEPNDISRDSTLAAFIATVQRLEKA